MSSSSGSVTPHASAAPAPPPSLRPQINLLRGWPSPSLLPVAALRAASSAALADPDVAIPGLLYGPDAGFQPLREELAAWLGAFYYGGDGEAYRHRHADRVTVTGGASQSLANILASFTDPAATRAVWMVAPCYFLACPIFADAGFAGRLRAVPEDADGPDVAALEAGMRALDAEHEGQEGNKERRRFKDPGPHRKHYRHVVYCVPSFANPSGTTTTRARREALVDLARRHDALVICDDVYDMLQWPVSFSSSSFSSCPSPSTSSADPDVSHALLPRLIDIDLASSPGTPTAASRFGNVVSNGSFSKLAGPGARTGWTYSSPAFAHGLSQTGATRSGGAPSQLTATALWRLLRDGALAKHISGVLRPAYRRRHARLLSALARTLPVSAPGATGEEDDGDGGGIRVHAVDAPVFGGYFVWLTLPASSSSPAAAAAAGGNRGERRRRRPWPPAAAVAARCAADEALLLGAGGLFEVHGDEQGARFPRALRLCFAWEDEDDLVEGVERLARVKRTSQKSANVQPNETSHAIVISA
ncbi:Aspartate/tyrosine/aromatic aminotransferase [Xylariomycetidae sp. FL0641]|nr:Aspartate/tyrosine/aromatic aminotransferase [Xylariomycetidae sp. FL0641]